MEGGGKGGNAGGSEGGEGDSSAHGAPATGRETASRRRSALCRKGPATVGAPTIPICETCTWPAHNGALKCAGRRQPRICATG